MKNNFIKRIIGLIVMATTILSISSIGVNAEWRNSDDGWKYYDDAGKIVTSSWLYDENTEIWCHLNENGIRTTGWMKDTNGKYYYLNADGAMAHDTTIDGYTLGSDGAWIQDNSNSSITTSNNNLPIQIPSNWRSLGDNKYSINNRSIVTYSVEDMTGWTQETVMNDLRKITYQQGNYDSTMGLVTYNGNNGYAYSYTSITKENMRKVLYIIIFKNNKHYDFIFISDYGNYDADRKELEKVLNSSLVL